ncbi:MAG: hypothetical protein K6F71_03990 [Ruminococcus sp.]|uniref:hypothetical protein n=1 Tax=Ruminococcus sp. TaxID=41978 RepID=UPI0025F0D72D|nr:hypothetical protein [Ruminococcus sp.]MCR5539983.1 hypothetical protein [Ruminococcus sp.]
MKKKHKIFIILLICAVLFIPVPSWHKDGGTVEYKAVTYSVRKVHSISNQHGTGYNVGTQVKILFWTVYDDVKFEPDASGI